jgi:hypothetical protein
LLHKNAILFSSWAKSMTAPSGAMLSSEACIQNGVWRNSHQEPFDCQNDQMTPKVARGLL